ncbi:MAG: tetratricopeptide repeat protein [Gemmatimonadetes bacterium]|nr:tetratricopeptide repeat protein [Gemmatimonadota bacterium]
MPFRTYHWGAPRPTLSALRQKASTARREARWSEAEACAVLGLRQAVLDGAASATTEFLSELGIVEFERGNLRDAERRFLDALEVARALDSASAMGAALLNLGAVANVRGRFERALEYYWKGRRAHHRAGDLAGEAQALNNLGILLADQKRWSGASRSYRMARRLAIEAGDDALVGLIALNAAEVEIEAERLSEARDACDEAVERLTVVNDALGIAEAYRHYGEIFRKSGKIALARAHFERAARQGRKLDAPLTEAEALRELGHLHLSKGRHRSALESFARSLKLFRLLEAAHDLADLEEKIGDLETLVVQLVERLGRQVESRGGAYLYGHSARVAEYAVAIACDLGFGPDQMKGILVAGYLHDIGKLEIDSAILNKEGRLTEREMAEIQRHPELAVEHLKRFELPWDVESMIRGHHERYDGTGYPDGLAGERIPLGARILLIADVFDALSTARPYRDPWSREQTLTYLEMSGGTLSDPEITGVFVEIARRESFGKDRVGKKTATGRAMRPEELAQTFASLPEVSADLIDEELSRS